MSSPLHPTPVPELDTDVSEIIQTQSEVVLPTIGVRVEEPAPVQIMPALFGAWRRHDLLLGGAAIQVLGHDPRRRRALLLAVNTAGTPSSVGLGSTQAQAGSDRAFLLSVTANSNVTPVQLEITHVGEVWAAAVTANITLSVLDEHWTN